MTIQPGQDPYYGADATNQTKSSMFEVQGVDVSSHNGNFDFAQAVGAGNIRFAFARASLGYGDPDKLFARNWAAIAEQGILRGAYHFAYPGTIAAGKTSEDDAYDEAMYFCETVQKAERSVHGGKPGWDGMMLPPVLDYEPTDPLSGQREWINKWIRTVQDQLQRGVLIYTGDGVWKKQLDADPWLTGMPLWVPHYSNGTKPGMAPWSRWVFWQWSGGGSGATYRELVGEPFPGVVAGDDVDLNAYWGSLEQLRLLARPEQDRWLVDDQGTVGPNPHASAPVRSPNPEREWMERHEGNLLSALASIQAALADLEQLKSAAAARPPGYRPG